MAQQKHILAAATALSDAVSVAPRSSGVYFFLDRRHELLYVGVAQNLRSRLSQHAHARRTGLYRRIAGVCWEELPDRETAAAREADLIVALQPPYNASIAGEGKWAYLYVVPVGSGRLGFVLSKDVEAPKGARAYGCFPHLGAGVGSLPGIACSDGYSALLRLLWAASGEGTHFPGRITRGSPPERFQVAMTPGVSSSLHTFLSGTSARLLLQLDLSSRRRPEYMHAGLARDLEAAEAFFTYGPRALRRLRLRHGLPPGFVEREMIEALLAEEVNSLLRS